MKLSPWTVYVIGVSFSSIPLAFGYFYGFAPKNSEAVATEKVIEDLKTVAQQYDQAKKQVDKAIVLAQQQAAQWQAIAATRTPPNTLAAGGIDLSVNSWQLIVDTRKFRNSIQIAVNNQVKKGGVKVLSGPQVAGISDDTPASTILTTFYNFPQPYGFPVVIRDLGAVTVQGTYDQIMANMRAWANMPHYLAVADGLRLQGTSPLLTGTYNVSIVGFIRANQVFPTVPELGSGGGGGAQLAGGGGRSGGGPMMMMGAPPIGAGGMSGMGGVGRGPMRGGG